MTIPNISPISRTTLEQISVTGKTKLHFNVNDELIYISYEFSGEERRQQITDTSYIGGNDWSDITRTLAFNEMIKQ